MFASHRCNALYTILASIMGLWLCAPALAETTVTLNEVQQGSLLLRSADPGRYVSVPVQDTQVRIQVTGPIARAKVRQHFRNPGDQWTEAVYAFPLPEEAAVDHLRMEVGDRVIEGQIQERGEARRTYETAAREGKRASLVEQQRPNLFTTSVANIPPRGEITVEIEYQQLLHWRDGDFSLRFPMAITPRYNPGSAGTLSQETQLDGGWAVLPGEIPNQVRMTPGDGEESSGKLNPVDLTIALNPGYPLSRVESRYHAIEQQIDEQGITRVRLKDGSVPADRDFVLEWTPAAGQSPSAAFFTEHTDAGDYGLLMVTPPAAAFANQQRLPREVIFVVDTSGSMGGASIRQARTALVLALSRLQAQDRFNLIQFNSVTHSLFKQPVAATAEAVQQAIAYTQGLEASGGTEMLPALAQAFSRSGEQHGALRQVVFITDGAVSNEQDLMELIHRQRGDRRLFTVGIGSAPNSHFMTEAAHLGHGSFTYIGQIDEVQERMAELFRFIEHPALTDLELHLPVASETLPANLPDLYLGEPVIIAMKLNGQPNQALLEGNIGDLRWQNKLALRASREQTGLGIHWARARIQQWERDQARGATPQDVRDAILELALRHHLVSRFTSLVAVDVTPVRPMDETAERHALDNNLPAGWQPPNPQASQQIAMAQGATSYPAWLMAGLMLLLIGLGLMRSGGGWMGAEQ